MLTPHELNAVFGPPSTKGRLELDERLIFMHFPKTAGTTIHNCLAPLFPPHLVCPERFPDICRWPISALQPYRFFSAHGTLRDFRFVPGPRKIITFLRNPVLKCLSEFEFWASHTDEAINAHNLHWPRLAKTLGLAGFFAPENHDQCGSVRNFYAKALVGSLDVSPTGRLWRSKEEILETAIQILDGFGFVGVTEDLEGSFAKLSNQLDIPNLYTGQRDNVTRRNPATNPGRFNALSGLDVNQGILASLQNDNDLDIKLYNHVLDRNRDLKVDSERHQCITGRAGQCAVRVGRTQTWVINQTGGFIAFGPYVKVMPGRYRVEWQVRGHPSTDWLPTDGAPGFLDVAAGIGKIALARTDIGLEHLTGEARTMQAEFETRDLLCDVEFRMFAEPNAKLEVEDTVTLTRIGGAGRAC